MWLSIPRYEDDEEVVEYLLIQVPLEEEELEELEVDHQDHHLLNLTMMNDELVLLSLIYYLDEIMML
jgi:hypothetical protein